jgi:hypothetical protein
LLLAVPCATMLVVLDTRRLRLDAWDAAIFVVIATVTAFVDVIFREPSLLGAGLAAAIGALALRRRLDPGNRKLVYEESAPAVTRNVGWILVVGISGLITFFAFLAVLLVGSMVFFGQGRDPAPATWFLPPIAALGVGFAGVVFGLRKQRT